ncbi:MAG: CidA/LrgA family protein [Acidobacteria bacterium]|nr:CidA/LrgA family protein [Acidobacteriota bacterium]
MIEVTAGTAVIVAIFLLGELLHRVGIPVPGGVLGLLLLFVSLQTGLVKLKWVERAAGFLLRHMVLLFIPLTVGLMDMATLLSRQAWIICTSIVLSFLAVLLVTGLLGDRLLSPACDSIEADKA